MAYIGPEGKAKLLPAIKATLAKYGMKGTVSIRHHSTLIVKLTAGKLDLIGNYNLSAVERNATLPEHMRRIARDELDINPYWAHEHFTGECLAFVRELLTAMDTGNHDRSDIMTDYHDVGWYRTVKVGEWNKPYLLTGPKTHVRFDRERGQWVEATRARG